MKTFEEKGITHLDLHGVRHGDASGEVIDFVYRHQSRIPLIIICGNSNRMIQIAEDSLKSNLIMISKPRFGIIRDEKI